MSISEGKFGWPSSLAAVVHLRKNQGSSLSEGFAGSQCFKFHFLSDVFHVLNRLLKYPVEIISKTFGAVTCRVFSTESVMVWRLSILWFIVWIIYQLLQKLGMVSVTGPYLAECRPSCLYLVAMAQSPISQDGGQGSH